MTLNGGKQILGGPTLCGRLRNEDGRSSSERNSVNVPCQRFQSLAQVDFAADVNVGFQPIRPYRLGAATALNQLESSGRISTFC
jgi:hypothetical protein